MRRDHVSGRHPGAAVLRAAVVFAVLLAVASPAAATSTAGTSTATKPVRGPAGLRFYAPPRHRPKGPHGTLIWERPLRGRVAFKHATNTALLYTQIGVDGRMVATSGYVAVPDSKPPKGGWPLITWGHGTTGIPDACAPSRGGPDGYIENSTNQPLLQSFIDDG